MRYIECDIMCHDNETVEIPVEIFESHGKETGLSFYVGHRPLVVFTPEGLAFSGLYEVPDGTYKVEFFRKSNYPSIDSESRVYQLYRQETDKVDFEEVQEAISTWVPIVDRLLLSGLMGLGNPKHQEN